MGIPGKNTNMITRDPNSLTNSVMQIVARELKKQGDIDLYGRDYDAARAIMFALVQTAVVKRWVKPPRKTAKRMKK